MNEGKIIGRLLKSNARSFQFACNRNTISVPEIGALVSAPIQPRLQAFGLITNISWLSDELVAQLARSETIERGVVTDNQFQRGIGQYIDVLMVGYKRDEAVYHALPPRPPLSLEQIKLCSSQEIVGFTGVSFAYYRLLQDAYDNIPFCDVVSAHLLQTHIANQSIGRPTWIQDAIDYLIDLLDDYDSLTQTLEALSQKGLEIGITFGE